MRLDQFLYAVPKEHRGKIEYKMKITSDNDIRSWEYKLTSGTEILMTWSKVNQIHLWMMEHGTVVKRKFGLQKSLLTLDQLKELMDTTNLVLEQEGVAGAERLAKKILPTRGAAYDRQYFVELEQTVEVLEQVITKVDPLKYDFYYVSSW